MTCMVDWEVRSFSLSRRLFLTQQLSRAGLNFKLSFIDDGSVCYYPDVNAERDQALFEVLPSQYTTFMRCVPLSLCD